MKKRNFYQYLMSKGVRLIDFGADGNCAYSAIVGGMAREDREKLGIWNFEDLRRKLAQYMGSIQEQYHPIPQEYWDELGGLSEMKMKVAREWFDEAIAPFVPFVTRHPLHIWTERVDPETNEVNGFVSSKFSRGSWYKEEPITIVLMNKHYVLADFSNITN